MTPKKRKLVVHQETLETKRVGSDEAGTVVLPDGSGMWMVDPDFSAVTGENQVHKKFWKADPDSNAIVPMSAEEQAQVLAVELENSKISAVKAIDTSVSRALTGKDGFEWPEASGNYFSLSLPAQVKWLGLFNARNSIQYPVVVRTKDDNATYSIQNAEEVEAIYLLIVTKVMTALDAANAAKAIVLDADNLSEINAVIKDFK